MTDGRMERNLHRFCTEWAFVIPKAAAADLLNVVIVAHIPSLASFLVEVLHLL